jgi:hypothetical protein
VNGWSYVTEARGPEGPPPGGMGSPSQRPGPAAWRRGPGSGCGIRFPPSNSDEGALDGGPSSRTAVPFALARTVESAVRYRDLLCAGLRNGNRRRPRHAPLIGEEECRARETGPTRGRPSRTGSPRRGAGESELCASGCQCFERVRRLGALRAYGISRDPVVGKLHGSTYECGGLRHVDLGPAGFPKANSNLEPVGLGRQVVGPG